jgi:hypothetical protein
MRESALSRVTAVVVNVVPPGLDADVCRLQKPVYRNRRRLRPHQTPGNR